MADTVFWYQSPVDTIPLGAKPPFMLVKDTSLFAQAVNGPLTFSYSLLTLEQANINFKGNMFNLVAHQAIALTAMAVRINGSGLTPINIYLKRGAYQGFEQQPTAWSLLYSDTVLVNTTGDFAVVNFTDTNLQAGDTLGVYIQVANGPNQVMYQSGNSSVSYSNAQLSFLSGAGIAQNFGTAYPNRTLNAEFYYQHGFNRLGTCASPVYEIKKLLSRQKLNLGFTRVFTPPNLTINLPQGFSQGIWLNLANADTLAQNNTLQVDTLLFPKTLDSLKLLVWALSPQGCWLSDTLTVLRSNLGIPVGQALGISIYPNPSSGQLFLSIPEACTLEVYNMSGSLVFEKRLTDYESQISIDHLPAGLFAVTLKGKGFVYQQKIWLKKN